MEEPVAVRQLLIRSYFIPLLKLGVHREKLQVPDCGRSDDTTSCRKTFIMEQILCPGTQLKDIMKDKRYTEATNVYRYNASMLV
jgi:hypothetical protein